MQAELLDSLAVDIATMIGISSWEEGDLLGQFSLMYEKRWSVDYATVQRFLQGLSMHTWHTVDELNVDMTKKVFESVENLQSGLLMRL